MNEATGGGLGVGVGIGVGVGVAGAVGVTVGRKKLKSVSGARLGGKVGSAWLHARPKAAIRTIKEKTIVAFITTTGA